MASGIELLRDGLQLCPSRHRQPDFLAENNGEGIYLFAKVAPHLERLRKEVSPAMFVNSEWVVNNSEMGKQRFDMFSQRVKTMLAAK